MKLVCVGGARGGGLGALMSDSALEACPHDPSTHLALCTHGTIKGGSLLGLAKVGVVWMTAP